MFVRDGVQVFGYDVLIDEDLRPWLLEVNASPSMARENKLDETVRQTDGPMPAARRVSC